MQQPTNNAEAKAEAKAKATKAKAAEAKAKAAAEIAAQKVFAKSAKAKKQKLINRLADAKELITYIVINDGKELIVNKDLKIAPKTVADIKARFGAEIEDHKTYNQDPTEYADMIQSLKTYGYIISTTKKQILE